MQSRCTPCSTTRCMSLPSRHRRPLITPHHIANSNNKHAQPPTASLPAPSHLHQLLPGPAAAAPQRRAVPRVQALRSSAILWRRRAAERAAVSLRRQRCPPPALCSMPADSHAQTSAVEAFCLALQSKTSNDWQQVCPLTCFRLGSRTSNVTPPALHALVLQPTTRRCFAVHGCPFSRLEKSAAGCCHLRLHV